MSISRRTGCHASKVGHEILVREDDVVGGAQGEGYEK
jgi:hypothetical protein